MSYIVDLYCGIKTSLLDSFVFDLNRLDKSRRAAYKLAERGLISWIASDSHAPEHYNGFRGVYDDFERDLYRNSIDFY